MHTTVSLLEVLWVLVNMAGFIGAISEVIEAIRDHEWAEDHGDEDMVIVSEKNRRTQLIRITSFLLFTTVGILSLFQPESGTPRTVREMLIIVGLLIVPTLMCYGTYRDHFRMRNLRIRKERLNGSAGE